MALLKLVINCNILLCLLMITVNKATASNETVKKVLPGYNGATPGIIKLQETDVHSTNIDMTPKQAVEPAGQPAATNKDASASNTGSADTVKQSKLPPPIPEQQTISPKERLQNAIEETKFNRKDTIFDYDEDELPDSYIKGFYIFLALSGAAMLFILVKLYRLRLSRAERKYGVQGDRSTQELVPLPTSIEDGISEDEDQTLFELNRQQIRIL